MNGSELTVVVVVEETHWDPELDEVEPLELVQPVERDAVTFLTDGCP